LFGAVANRLPIGDLLVLVDVEPLFFCDPPLANGRAGMESLGALASSGLDWMNLARRPATEAEARAFLSLARLLPPVLANALRPNPADFPHVEQAWPRERGKNGSQLAPKAQFRLHTCWVAPSPASRQRMVSENVLLIPSYGWQQPSTSSCSQESVLTPFIHSCNPCCA
jgi:hypothetical protein